MSVDVHTVYQYRKKWSVQNVHMASDELPSNCHPRGIFNHRSFVTSLKSFEQTSIASAVTLLHLDGVRYTIYQSNNKILRYTNKFTCTRVSISFISKFTFTCHFTMSFSARGWRTTASTPVDICLASSAVFQSFYTHSVNKQTNKYINI